MPKDSIDKVDGTADERRPAVTDEGFRGPQVCALVGITYRQLDYWARTGCCGRRSPMPRGSGSQRRYSYSDVLELKVIKRLLDAGLSCSRPARPSSACGGTSGPTWPHRNWCWSGPLGARPLRWRGRRPAGGRPGGVQHRASLRRRRRARTRPSSRSRDAPAASTAAPSGRRLPGVAAEAGRALSAAVAGGEPNPLVTVTRFAHDSERQFAALLDFYGVRWEYEPVEFVLEWHHRRPAHGGVPTRLLAARARPASSS